MRNVNNNSPFYSLASTPPLNLQYHLENPAVRFKDDRDLTFFVFTLPATLLAFSTLSAADTKVSYYKEMLAYFSAALSGRH